MPLLPKNFANEREFLEDIETRSKTPKTSFTIEQINYLYELAGEKFPFDFSSPSLSSPYISITLPYDNPKTRELLYKASKNISEKAKKLLEFNVLYLDPYRENNNISYLDDYK